MLRPIAVEKTNPDDTNEGDDVLRTIDIHNQQ